MLAASAVACLIAGTASAQTYAYAWTPGRNLGSTPPAPTFLMFAGAGDLYEIQSSQLVLETTRNPDTRRFAQVMAGLAGLLVLIGAIAGASARGRGRPRS